MKSIDKLEKAFSKLKKRIILHRNKCEKWKKGKTCYDCHKNTITQIEKEIKELRYK